jgi:hypothetical protein
MKDREVFTTNGTYPWSFVTQICHNGQPSHGGDRTTFEVIAVKGMILHEIIQLIVIKQQY